MNVSRLLEIFEVVLDLEGKFSIQTKLNGLVTAFSNLASQPAQPTHQEAVSSALSEFKPMLEKLHTSFTPAQLVQLEEIGAYEFFEENIAKEIQNWLSENAATPATALNKLKEFATQRQEYLTKISSLKEQLISIGFATSELEVGQAEIGFLLPRELFENNLKGLTSELRALERIIGTLSEVSTGSVEQAEIRQISTSDPIFFFGLSLPIIVAIGGVVTWSLSTWKQVEEIRLVRMTCPQSEGHL